ncbi:MAG: hypothetical protein QOI58_319 [Thermoanaerobaculia bacterium]|jgi:hypothetical protein|nr:hypothetical protein [Thermoanaerobaculia bacterium]
MVVRIREEQLEALREAARLDFERECIALVLERWRDVHAGWSAETIAAEVRELLAIAPSWGYTGERERYRLVNAAALLGLGFHRRGEGHWALQLLRDERLPVDTRIGAVIERVRRGEKTR